MKDRIMHYLQAFIRGEEDNLAQELMNELKLDEATFRERVREVQSAILHGYQHFSISTIDAFFQRVIRSFTREAGISSDYNLEIEHDDVMEMVIKNLMDELGHKKELTNWIVELALQNLENEKSWDMRQSLLKFSDQIFREEFKAIEKEVNETTSQENFFQATRNMLYAIREEFIQYNKSRAQQIFTGFVSRGLTTDYFKYKTKGSVYTIVKKLGQATSTEDKLNIRGEMYDAANWFNKEHPQYKQLVQQAEVQWVSLFREMMDSRENKMKGACTAEAILAQFSMFGLLSDVSRKLSDYKHENNILLLAEAAYFLSQIIDNSDTPFIYEKIGSFYRHYLIDEFQDTSGLQWKNLKPLIYNSLDSGYACLLVGDVKQAIYRWRGGDQDLLQQQAGREAGESRTKIFLLDKNFRSDSEIVAFNNRLFQTLATTLLPAQGISVKEYNDVEQTPVKTDNGWVQVTMIEDSKTEGWKTAALAQTAKKIEELQQRGVAPGHIALLVRKNKEGEEIISYLAKRKDSLLAQPGCVYDVISNESLCIGNASTVKLLTAAMTYLLHPEDAIARTQLAYEYTRIHQPGKSWNDVFLICATAAFESLLPTSFSKQKHFLKKLPLFELTETLIDIFSLKDQLTELAYLLAFQNRVLEFSYRNPNDLLSFLEWWKDAKDKQYITAPADADAMRLFTLHKAKGLQFQYVIIPFCAWATDHEGNMGPLLWEKLEHEPFSSLGYLPVKYSSGLANTFFEEVYQTEKNRTHLDNLNLLYVAFTRAEKGLFVFAPYNNKNNVSDWVHKAIMQSPELVANWNETTLTYQSGSMPAATPVLKRKPISSSLSTYLTQSWRTKLIIKRTNTEPGTEGQRDKQERGKRLHALLSRVKLASDVDKAIFYLEASGEVNVDEKKELNAMLTSMLANPQVADWFTEKWNIQTEVSTLSPGGKEWRIDRLLLQGQQAVVIDYKTGTKQKKDQEQVAEYCMLLNDMGFQTQGYLLYLSDEMEVQQVTLLNRKKVKNKNQLGLDFTA